MHSVRVLRFNRQIGCIPHARVTQYRVSGTLLNPTEEAQKMMAGNEYFVFVCVLVESARRPGIAEFRADGSVSIEIYAYRGPS